MAIRTKDLPIGAATLPDGTTGNAAPGMQRVKASGTAPVPFDLMLVCDASTREQAIWGKFRMPADYVGSPTLKVQFTMATATSGNVMVGCRIAAVTPLDAQDVDAKAFAAVNLSTATSVPGTAGYLKDISITLTNVDGLAAGDAVNVHVSREADNASDTAAGDMEIRTVSLDYSDA